MSEYVVPSLLSSNWEVFVEKKTTDTDNGFESWLNLWLYLYSIGFESSLVMSGALVQKYTSICLLMLLSEFKCINLINILYTHFIYIIGKKQKLPKAIQIHYNILN